MTPRRWRWVAGASAAAAVLVAGVTWWAADEESDLRGSPFAAPVPARASDPPAEIVPVPGNPGYEALDAEGRALAGTEMSSEAREWLVENRGVVAEVARAMEVSPVALGGIVAAEKTLLVGRVDALGEELFRAVFGSLRERDLEGWVEDQEERYRRETAGEIEAARFGVRSPYEWTLGPAQVSFRLALHYEPVVAARMDRPERNVKEVVRAVTSEAGNLEYAAALLAEGERAYRELAGMDISGNPGVLATLYHLGAPTVRARRLAEENAERRARGARAQPPQVNYYGAFVNLHAAEIAAILRGGAG